MIVHGFVCRPILKLDRVVAIKIRQTGKQTVSFPAWPIYITSEFVKTNFTQKNSHSEKCLTNSHYACELLDRDANSVVIPVGSPSDDTVLVNEGIMLAAFE
jgi:hypothetical protein